jgi:hypothetical protein
VNPQKRPTAQQVVQHEYFQIKSPLCKPNIKLEEQEHSRNTLGIFQNVKYKPGTVCQE